MKSQDDSTSSVSPQSSLPSIPTSSEIVDKKDVPVDATQSITNQNSTPTPNPIINGNGNALAENGHAKPNGHLNYQNNNNNYKSRRFRHNNSVPNVYYQGHNNYHYNNHYHSHSHTQRNNQINGAAPNGYNPTHYLPYSQDGRRHSQQIYSDPKNLYYGHLPMDFTNQPPQFQPYYPIPSIPENFALIVQQVEYYFSVENLCKDVYLRRKMNSQGFVKLETLANFNRVKSLTGGDFELFKEALKWCPTLEIQGNGIRTRNGWNVWILPQESRDDDVVDVVGVSIDNEMPSISNNIEKTSLQVQNNNNNNDLKDEDNSLSSQITSPSSNNDTIKKFDVAHATSFVPSSTTTPVESSD